MKYIIGFLIAFGITCQKAFVLSILWMWFIVDLGFPEIGFWPALGVIVIGDLFSRLQVPDNKDPIKALKFIGLSVAKPWIALGLGFIAHLFSGGLS